ncbi:MAG: 4-(cytidine 5'-diphospho)-2-C-methyl-D-erythritol kinase [Natronospirillum sp.]|uniref:4-(cytidine 5'-diphospho)-2-C-methyl-D-erythritol kinase n=1 Tax=Natronospirillum sp. TaxID=2812955 RepID=UPI0025DED926|nr:4-(cytidine 5'-diphospho)-2-C-methyl-D-erythritol kinase [Natronospirillum sp.]MCH8553009.1 4-(cytidine 5'-diphospho)-2-C-methyl-D-erythritol kinase [Natronospirillum sp.]
MTDSPTAASDTRQPCPLPEGDSLILPAPAKLNLMLHITGRRADGYHELQTLFQLLDHGDQLTFSIEPGADGRIRLSDSSGLPTADNLITRAATLMRDHARHPVNLHIELDKRLPIGGGLGGGSSDGATTLLALNTLWGCALDTDTLADLGRQLGADVPVFVRGHSAWAEGIGERLQPVELPEHWFVVCHPGISVSTAEVFGNPGLTRNSQITTIRSALRGDGRNDCEPVVRQRYPEIRSMLDTMSAFGPARLTGTGACGFITLPDEGAARRAESALRARYATFAAPGLNRSPVLDRLAALTLTIPKTRRKS